MDRETLAVIISGLSFLASGFVLWRQHEAQGRAHFTAEWESPSSIIYLNHGPGAATDVHVRLATRVHPIDLSFPYIGAFQVMRIGGFIRVLGEEPPSQLDVSWRDNRRKRQSVPIHLPDPPSSGPRVQTRDALEKVVRELARDEAQQEFNDQVRKAGRRQGY